VDCDDEYGDDDNDNDDYVDDYDDDGNDDDDDKDDDYDLRYFSYQSNIDIRINSYLLKIFFSLKDDSILVALL
jgi:hypothetical protein